MVLSSVNTQLPQLRTLILKAGHSWTGAQAVWEQLGETTQLTQLSIGFVETVDVGAHVKDLAPLSSLTSLQKLSFRLVNNAEQLPLDGVEPGDAGFLSSLTALTELRGDFVLKPDMLSNISSCTDLQDLALVTDVAVQPSSSDWQVLGSLTALTELHVSGSMLRDQDPQPFHSALERLTSLQAATAGHWTCGAVPILAALTKLTSVDGAWAAEDQGWDGKDTCERVVKVHLHEEGRTAPFRAFPKLETLMMSGPLNAASWVELAKYCPKVKQITHTVAAPSARPDVSCFPPNVDGRELVTAFKGLAQLTDLRHLGICVSHKIEIIALAAALQQLTGLTCLALALRSHPMLDWGCLLPLCKLSSVLTADFTIRVPLPSRHEAQMLLAAFTHVRHISLVVSAADVATVEEAVHDSIFLGLGLPKHHVSIKPLLE